MGGNVQVVSDADFTEKIIKSEKPVIVDFWAPWCGPCMSFAPELEEWAEKAAGKVDVFKLETNYNPVALSRLMIMAIPTLILFVNGQEEKRAVGIPEARELLNKVRNKWIVGS